MRKAEREIIDFNEIIDLIQNMDTIRIGINDEKYPYVVPVSFGFDVKDKNLTFYFHGAKTGKKFNLINKNPYVCVEGDICYRFKDTITSVTCLYESIIAFGKCELISNKDEALYAMKSLLKHCGYENHEINEKVLSVTAVYKITIKSITGKCRDKHN